jgi:hypothetical protein
MNRARVGRPRQDKQGGARQRQGGKGQEKKADKTMNRAGEGRPEQDEQSGAGKR